MPADLHERTPGVYVRAEHEFPHELDMLWSNTRAFHKEERSPVVTFVAGAVVGALITAAGFMLVINRPQITTSDSELIEPVVVEDLQPAPIAKKPVRVSHSSGSASVKVTPANTRTYAVQNGDTLGGIAYKVYGSSAPNLVEKLQRANGLSSPDSLQIDQKLVVPPRNY